MKISTVKQMRQLDQTAIDRYGIADALLMENAGLAAVTLLKSKIKIENQRIMIICGSGNNGGDGLVCARHLHSLGAQVNVLLLSDPDRYQGSSAQNYQIIQKIGLSCIRISDMSESKKHLEPAALIVDAILGTGLSGPIKGLYADAIQVINQSGLPVLSLDIPSGVNGDTGEVMGNAVQAAWTITFGLPKPGNLLFPGFLHNGELYVTHISFPREILTGEDLSIEINLPPALPHRREDGHKGTFGQALFIAGAASYYGAPYFSALGFMKAGGGYSRLASPRSITPFLANKGSEIVFLPQPETDQGSLASKALDALLEAADLSDFVVIGPGISLVPETQALARNLIEQIDKPILIDGDGLSALRDNLSILQKRNAPTVLTPHPGEMARLAGKSSERILAQALDVVREFSTEFNTHLVLKGAHTLIGTPDGRIFINMTGNAGMATAGSGDVLTGTIAAMAGLGMKFEDAVRKGVFMHGLAGDLAAEAIGPDGMTAQDVLNFLPLAMKKDRQSDIYKEYPHYKGAIPV